MASRLTIRSTAALSLQHSAVGYALRWEQSIHRNPILIHFAPCFTHRRYAAKLRSIRLSARSISVQRGPSGPRVARFFSLFSQGHGLNGSPTAPVERPLYFFSFHPLNGGVACQLSTCARRSRPFRGRAIREHRERQAPTPSPHSHDDESTTTHPRSAQRDSWLTPSPAAVRQIDGW
jgi:hypothetical protein